MPAYEVTAAGPQPQTVAEALAALRKAREFIRNGVALGFIRMPDADTPDSAHETLPIIQRAIAADADRAALASPPRAIPAEQAAPAITSESATEVKETVAVQEATKAFDGYLCRAWGETDMTAAEIVRDWEGVRRFMVREWLGEEDATDYDGANTLERFKTDFDEHCEDRRGGAYVCEFEIGGVSVEQVRGFESPLPVAPKAEPTYSSTQATNCAGCGKHKHTPLRIDAMGGYVCLTCIGRKLDSLLAATPQAGAQPVVADTPEARMFAAAVAQLAEISDALGIDPEEAACANGNDLILAAIARKNEALLAALRKKP